jgi:hypothetical protein
VVGRRTSRTAPAHSTMFVEIGGERTSLRAVGYQRINVGLKEYANKSHRDRGTANAQNNIVWW